MVGFLGLRDEEAHSNTRVSHAIAFDTHRAACGGGAVFEENEFCARAAEWLCDKADVLPGRTLLDEGWFGAGDLHPRLAERVGDFVLLMREPYTIKDWVAGEPRHPHIGNHGGLSADEMHIPLVYAGI